MKLPKIEHPTYEVKLTSREQPVRFRPFLVKEQKLLLMAVESESSEDIVSAMKQIITNCCLEDIDVDALPYVDIELFFLNLRARSVGEKIEAFFKCNNTVEDDVTCNMIINFDVDLLKQVEVINLGKPREFDFGNGVGVRMKYPTIEHLNTLEKEGDVSDLMIVECLDIVYNDDESHKASDASKEELLEWVGELPQAYYDKLAEFIRDVPTIQYKGQHPCPKCGFVHEMKLEGLDDFFI